jgi:CRP/FNR family transcriptional regulator, cyclic AMP receptor protein
MVALEDRAEAFAKARDAGSANDALVIARWGTNEWATLFSYATVVKLPAGSTLIRQQGPDRALYFLISGRLEAAVSYGEQTLAPLRIVQPGSVVGEVAFFDAAPRSARVWAVEDSELLRLGTDDYDRFAAANLALANELLFGLGRLVALRLRHLTVRATSRQ